MLPCPQCGEYHYHRSHTKNDYERIRRFVLKQRKYRCHKCGYKGWEKTRSLDKGSLVKSLVLYGAVIVIAVIVGFLTKSFLM